MADTWQNTQEMHEYTGAGGLLRAIKEEAKLEPDEWAKLYDTATPYQRRCARLILDPTCAPHGEPSTYTNWGCRCDLCSIAYSQSRTGAAMKRDFGDDPAPGEEDDVPEQIARLKALVAQGITPNAKGQALLDEWDAAHVI